MSNLSELISLCKCGVSIEVNSHKQYYMTVYEYLKDSTHVKVDDDVISDEMIKRDSVVELLAYVDTPIGSICCYHYDLDMAINEVLDAIKG